ncbi:MAG: hypothetical protein ACI31G_04695 [Bacilli bacterium]
MKLKKIISLGMIFCLAGCAMREKIITLDEAKESYSIIEETVNGEDFSYPTLYSLEYHSDFYSVDENMNTNHRKYDIELKLDLEKSQLYYAIDNYYLIGYTQETVEEHYNEYRYYTDEGNLVSMISLTVNNETVYRYVCTCDDVTTFIPEASVFPSRIAEIETLFQFDYFYKLYLSTLNSFLINSYSKETIDENYEVDGSLSTYELKFTGDNNGNLSIKNNYEASFTSVDSETETNVETKIQLNYYVSIKNYLPVDLSISSMQYMTIMDGKENLSYQTGNVASLKIDYHKFTYNIPNINGYTVVDPVR